MRTDPRSKFFPQKGGSLAQPWYASLDPSTQYAAVSFGATSFGTGTRSSPSGAFGSSTTVESDLGGLWVAGAGVFANGAFQLPAGIWIVSFAGYWNESGRGIGSSRGVGFSLT